MATAASRSAARPTRSLSRSTTPHCNAAEGASAMQRLATVDQVAGGARRGVQPRRRGRGAGRAGFPDPARRHRADGPSSRTRAIRFTFRVNADNTQLNKALAAYVASAKLVAARLHRLEQRCRPRRTQRHAGSCCRNLSRSDTSAISTSARSISPAMSPTSASSGAKAVMLLMDEEPGALAIKQIRDAGLDRRSDRHAGDGLRPGFSTGSNAKYLNGMVQYNAFPPNLPMPRIKPSTRRTRRASVRSPTASPRSPTTVCMWSSKRWRRPAPSAMARRSATRSPQFRPRASSARSSSTAKARRRRRSTSPDGARRHAQGRVSRSIQGELRRWLIARAGTARDRASAVMR